MGRMGHKTERKDLGGTKGRENSRGRRIVTAGEGDQPADSCLHGSDLLHGGATVFASENRFWPATHILRLSDELSVVCFRFLAEGELTGCDVLTVTVV